MSLSVLMRELAALGPKDRRRVLTYLVSLQSANDAAHKRKMAALIDEKDLSKFATLEDLDARLRTADARSAK